MATEQELAEDFRRRYRAKLVSRANLPNWATSGKYTVEGIRDESLRSAIQFTIETAGPDNPSPGIVISGQAGRGKTTAAALALKGILETGNTWWLGRTEGHLYPTRPGYYLTYANFLHNMKRSWDSDAPGDLNNLVDSLMCSDFIPEHERCRILVIDDVGKEMGKPGEESFASRTLHDLLRSRYDRSAITILTTNLRDHEWEVFYGPAMASFIKTFTSVKAAGSDLRA